MTLTSIINCYHLRTHTTGDKLDAALSFISVGICLNMPLLVLINLTNKSKKYRLQEPQLKNRYGAIYQELKTKRFSDLLEPVFFLARRVIIVLVVLVLQRRPLA